MNKEQTLYVEKHLKAPSGLPVLVLNILLMLATAAGGAAGGWLVSRGVQAAGCSRCAFFIGACHAGCCLRASRCCSRTRRWC